MLTMTAEWSQRTALTTFTLEPRRDRVLAAKVVASLAISVVGGCLAFVIPRPDCPSPWRADGTQPSAGAGGKLGEHRRDLRLDAGRPVVRPRPQIASSALIWVALHLAIGSIRITRRDIR
jgi:hypothetical protein